MKVDNGSSIYEIYRCIHCVHIYIRSTMYKYIHILYYICTYTLADMSVYRIHIQVHPTKAITPPRKASKTSRVRAAWSISGRATQMQSSETWTVLRKADQLLGILWIFCFDRPWMYKVESLNGLSFCNLKVAISLYLETSLLLDPCRRKLNNLYRTIRWMEFGVKDLSFHNWKRLCEVFSWF